ncbi:MAG: glycine cleavage system protein T [Verrucomicrobiales bacterium]|nr:glycine cleavage system protein T [Verrucomicrobiales bacterium]
MPKLKRTPLFPLHEALNARCVDFGGWEMPIQYDGVIAEHQAVRNAAGVFDISHMGEIMVGGAHAEDFLELTLTNRASDLAVGDAQYSLLCNSQGGVVDDLYVYRIAQEVFLLIVNASRVDDDFSLLQKLVVDLKKDRTVNVVNESDDLAAIAVQGPNVSLFIDDVFTLKGLITVDKPTDLTKNQIDVFIYEDANVYVANTGYTGEAGFELVAPNEVITQLWNRIFDLGKNHGVKPAGLGARDTLRLEMGYPLYGNELNEKVTPLEAGLGYFIDLEKPFQGRQKLVSQKNNGFKRKNLGFVMTSKSPPPRKGYLVYIDGDQVGAVSSGTQSPSLGKGMGMAFIDMPHALVGKEVEIQIRDRYYPAVLSKKPMYKKDD